MINLKKEEKPDIKQDYNNFGRIIIKEKIHNSKEDLMYLQSLYNLAKKYTAVTYDFSNCKYISFICLVMFKMYVDRLQYQDCIDAFILKEDEEKNLNISIKDIENLSNTNIQDLLYIQNYGIEMKEAPLDDLEKIENELDNSNLCSRLKQIVGELVGNVLSHTNDGIDYKKYKMYFGIRATKKLVQVVVSNNGKPFSNVIYNSDKSKQIDYHHNLYNHLV